jgi:hypothetical protein
MLMNSKRDVKSKHIPVKLIAVCAFLVESYKLQHHSKNQELSKHVRTQALPCAAQTETRTILPLSVKISHS